jgi:hypothetical protein
VRNSLGARFPILRLIGLTAATLAIHGYHLGVEDGETYLPTAKKLLNSGLYPYATEFFLPQGNMSLFGSILAWTARLTHMSMDWTLLVWYVACIFAMLVSCWLLLRACFSSSRAQWSGMLVITAVLTMPATNTALLLMDPYLTARSFSTPLTLLSLACFLERRYALAAAATALTAVIHPQMSVYLVFLMGVLLLQERRKSPVREPLPVLASIAVFLPTNFRFAPASGNYREALYSRDYYFLYNWSWYHWLGMIAPLAILAWFWKGKLRGTLPGFQRISFALIPFGLLSIAAAAVLASSPDLEMFARLQPLRTFHLITILFVLLLAGVVGEYLGKKHAWAIAALSIALAAGMYLVNRDTYPNSPQIEFPSATSSNPWVNMLLWVRQNTPTDAVFAVDSRYFNDNLSDVHGFRAISERSALADYFKDGGEVCLFPDLADEWKQMSNATYSLNHFSTPRFRSLREQYPVVSWTAIHGPAPAGMNCPYQQQGYSVCHMPSIAEQH